MKSEATAEALEEAAGEVQPEVSPEKLEEEKLMKKYPQMKRAPNALVQKRLQHGQRKFFDSGDYNMAKAKGQLKLNPMARPAAAAKAEPARLEAVADDPAASPTGNAIPTPDTVPLRKSSIIHPTSDKLSPQPLVHHDPDSPLREEAD